MNWGDNSGLQNMPGMPDAGTSRAWQSLAPPLIHDNGIMFELFNEPRMDWGSAASHKTWAAGMQILIDLVRSLGATNILLLDGLGYAQWTNDLFPLVHDRMANRMAMAVHPYLDPMRGEDQRDPHAYWRKHFSISAAQVPMIATEWNATPTVGCAGVKTPELSLGLMRLLASLHVGVIGWAIDTSAKLVENHTDYKPTDYVAFKDCKDGTDTGGGKLLANFPNN
ncbi:cellulase family glycosylhydrolase [Ralstonia pickettii]|uniref:Cellulase family glycosylhydrolase n=1 Tax=Ralstonia pickettii TaxID=329 RepID=A0A7X2HSB2_RALPI|nr:cellulase family glycosylhydrolase [Ralstonia pickettii]MRT01773.1 cellulase family glycosylhydrolase [Ralstonia pickettii]